MLYRACVAAAIIAASGSAAFSPGLQPPPLGWSTPARLPTPVLAAGGGTETVDFTLGAIRPNRDVVDDQMRPRPSIDWSNLRARLEIEFGIKGDELAKFDEVSDDDLVEAYSMMALCRNFENACNQAYMQGSIRGFMHLDNGQETIPAVIADTIRKGDKKVSYYREHTHALASGVDPAAVMAELFAKDTGTCRGTGGSMHIYDKATNFQVPPPAGAFASARHTGASNRHPSLYTSPGWLGARLRAAAVRGGRGALDPTRPRARP